MRKPAFCIVVVVVLGFYVPPTAKVIRRRDLGLKSHPKDQRSPGSNSGPLVYKAGGSTTTPLHLGFLYMRKTKTQISFAVTTKLISAFVFATQVVKSLYFLNTKFQASSHLVWLCSLVCVGPGRKPRRPVFSQRGSYHKCQFL